MANDIIDLDEARLERMPHATLHVRCVVCGHDWQATAPIPWPSSLECSRCINKENAPMIEMRWLMDGPNNGHLEYRSLLPSVDASGAFCPPGVWTEWARVPQVFADSPDTPSPPADQSKD